MKSERIIKLDEEKRLKKLLSTMPKESTSYIIKVLTFFNEDTNSLLSNKLLSRISFFNSL